MRIACPSCHESYRIEPARLPGRRVRAACLACGEALYLRLADGDGLSVPGAAAFQQEVPLWSESRARERDVAGPAAPAGFERVVEPQESVEPEEIAGPEEIAEPEAPIEVAPFLEPSQAAPPEELAAHAGPVDAPARPLAPFLEPGAPEAPPRPERPLEPYLEPATAPPAAPAPGREQESTAAAESVRAGFTFSRVGDVSSRAQRLARALVSDILVYHPKKVEQGIREDNLKELMKDEVEKSWDEYCGRLGVDAARANRGHFLAALNEILARGKRVF